MKKSNMTYSIAYLHNIQNIVSISTSKHTTYHRGNGEGR